MEIIDVLREIQVLYNLSTDNLRGQLDCETKLNFLLKKLTDIQVCDKIHKAIKNGKDHITIQFNHINKVSVTDIRAALDLIDLE